MLYIKTKLNDQEEIKVDLYDDEIYTICPACGKEHQIDSEHLKQIDDWSSTSISCGSDECNRWMHEEVKKTNSPKVEWDSINSVDIQEDREQEINNEDSVHELLHKQMTGQLTIEEANELTNKSIALAVESMETVSDLKERLRLWEGTASYWYETAAVFQEFITFKGLNDDLTLFIDETYSEINGNVREDPEENQTTSTEEIVH